MSTTGNAESYIELRGELSIPDAIRGKSAYEIAVANGFEGTEAEWLESLTEQTEQNAAEVIESANAKIAELNETAATAKTAVETAETEAVEHLNSLAEGAYNISQFPGASTTQVMSQKTVTDEIFETEENLSEYDIRQGSIDHFGFQERNTRCATYEYIPVTLSSKVYFRPQTGYKYAMIRYDARYSYLDTMGWKEGEAFYDVGNAAYIRIVIANTRDTEITPDVAVDNVAVTIYSNKSNKIYDIQQGVENESLARKRQGRKNGYECVIGKVANGTAWNPTNANFVCSYEYIAVKPGDLISMQVETDPDNGYHYGFGYVTYDSNKNYILPVDPVGTRTEIKDLAIDANVAYIRFTVGQYDSSNNYIAKRYTDYTEYDFSYYIKNATKADDYVCEDIETKLLQAVRIAPTYAQYIPTNIPNLLTLIHFSDIHGDVENISRIVGFKNIYGKYINDIVHTGDTTIDYLESANPFDTAVGGKEVLNVVGNHDCWRKGENGYFATKAEAYAKILEGRVNYWNVTQPTNAAVNYDCYYYKDYPTNGFRLVALDCMHWDAAQATWLTNVLSDAKANGLAIVALSHYPPELGINKVNCSFSSVDNFPTAQGWERLVDAAFDIVDTFISGGGEFICWLMGHCHADYIGTAIDHPEQLVVGIEKGGTIGHGADIEVNRVKGTTTQDLFNVVSFDKTNKLVKLIRVGCNYDKFMRHKGTLCYNYSTKTIIADN